MAITVHLSTQLVTCKSITSAMIVHLLLCLHLIFLTIERANLLHTDGCILIATGQCYYFFL